MSKPLTDKKFDLKQKAINAICGPDLITYRIPSDEFDLLAAPKAIWDPAYASGNREMSLTRNKIQTKTKSLSRKDYEKTINTFVRRWVKENPYIPAAKKLEMYIHINSISKHHNVRPKTHPVTDSVDSNHSQHLIIDLMDSESSAKHKPDGVLRLESWVFIQEPKLGKDGKIVVDDSGHIVYMVPLKDSDYIHWGLDSSTIEVDLEFMLEDVGKGVYIRNRFANNVDSGDFGEVIITFIPK